MHPPTIAASNVAVVANNVAAKTPSLSLSPPTPRINLTKNHPGSRHTMATTTATATAMATLPARGQARGPSAHLFRRRRRKD
ncbi:hypothetical protein SLS62_001272 [Diatrype stigma]|uniref:Uncharacterized protein n=1 Tax=Diatrype stigma TaxID=117547 RepID=A0AAN9YW45_9PEZI